MHTTDNLILLCPNWHALTHKNEITKTELFKRKSTHLKGDRISGGFKTNVEYLRLIVCANNFEQIGGSRLVIQKHNDENIITLKKEAESLLLSLRFYDKNCNLNFWMSDNYYWTESIFRINCSLNNLEISDVDNEVFFKIREEQGCLIVTGKHYLNGRLCEINNNHYSVNGLVIQNCSFSGSGPGIRSGIDKDGKPFIGIG